MPGLIFNLAWKTALSNIFFKVCFIHKMYVKLLKTKKKTISRMLRKRNTVPSRKKWKISSTRSSPRCTRMPELDLNQVSSFDSFWQV